jgi:hypothetical protein
MPELNSDIQYLINCMKSEFGLALGPIESVQRAYKVKRPAWKVINYLSDARWYLIFFELYDGYIELSSINHSISIFHRDFINHHMVVDKIKWFIDTAKPDKFDSP